MDGWRKQKGGKEKQREGNARAAGRGKGGGREEVNELSEAVLQCYTSAFRESSATDQTDSHVRASNIQTTSRKSVEQLIAGKAQDRRRRNAAGRNDQGAADDGSKCRSGNGSGRDPRGSAGSDVTAGRTNGICR